MTKRQVALLGSIGLLWDPLIRKPSRDQAERFLKLRYHFSKKLPKVSKEVVSILRVLTVCYFQLQTRHTWTSWYWKYSRLIFARSWQQLGSVQQNRSRRPDFSWSEWEVEKRIKNSKNDIAAGFDGVPYEILKLAKNALSALLADLFNTMFDISYTPAAWAKGIVCSISKVLLEMTSELTRYLSFKLQ